MDLDLSWIVEKVIVPAASAFGGGLLVGRQARRSFHAAKFSEEEAKAYEAVLADLKMLRVSAASSLKLLERSWQWPEVQESASEVQKAEEFRIAKTEAFERLREVVVLGPV